MSPDGIVDAGLILSAAVGTRNDTRGPFVVGVPFVYNSSLHISGSVQTRVFVRVGPHVHELCFLLFVACPTPPSLDPW